MTLGAALERAANQAPERGVSYIVEDGTAVFQPYPQLLAEAGCVLAGLRGAGLRAGDKLILAPTRNQEFVPAFWACIVGGIIPVPLAAPGALFKSRPAVERLANVWNALDRPPVMLDQAPSNQLSAGQLNKEGNREHTAAGVPLPASSVFAFSDFLRDGLAPSFHDAQPDDIAFIQFSSGSTGQPKGVVLTHRNILANIEAIEAGLGMQASDITLNWMPLYHDMGLVGYHLVPLHFCISQFHLQTACFVRRPLVWLDALEEYGATITASPNFGLALLLSRLERTQGGAWDLSKVRLLLNGAEPISVPLMERAAKVFAAFGASPQAMFPVYGLAEATLAVAFPPLGEEPRVEAVDRRELQMHGRAVPAIPADLSAICFASEGCALDGCQIRIVDDQDQPVEQRVVGHIQVRGGNVMKGYYDDPEATADAFCESQGEAWLRTGDLGFIAEGRLCVTGRAKDIIFVNGQNYYAHDLEDVAQRVEGVQPGRVVFCGWHDPQAGRERLLMFLASASVDDAASLAASGEMLLKVKTRLQNELGLTRDVMIPVRARHFPKTTSGKLQRYKLREQFERGEFDAAIEQMACWLAAREQQDKASRAARAAPRTPTEKLLHQAWCEEIGLKPEEVGIHDRFEELGGKSIHAAIIVARIESHFGFTLHSEVLAAHPTIGGIAAYIDRHGAALRGGAGEKRAYFRG